MTTSEPTTGACRRCGIKISSDQNRCTQCIVWILRLLAKARSPWGSVHEEAADRLEQLERDNAALTARAEQAEKERDAAVAVIGIQAEKLKESHVVLCNICEFEDMIGCAHKNHCDGYQLFKWRGKPQEGVKE